MTADAKVGVTVEIAATFTASLRPIFLAYAAEQTIIAAAPSDVAQISIKRSGSATIAEAAEVRLRDAKCVEQGQ